MGDLRGLANPGPNPVQDIRVVGQTFLAADGVGVEQLELALVRKGEVVGLEQHGDGRGLCLTRFGGGQECPASEVCIVLIDQARSDRCEFGPGGRLVAALLGGDECVDLGE